MFCFLHESVLKRIDVLMVRTLNIREGSDNFCRIIFEKINLPYNYVYTLGTKSYISMYMEK